jgi:two-component system phosphate regulon sensor histidine kinase PhoR
MFASRLLWKFLLVYLAIYAATLALALPLALRWGRQQIIAELQRSLGDIANLVGRDLSAALPQGEEALQKTMRKLSQQIGRRITLVGSSGRVLADSEEAPDQLPNQREQPEIAAAIRGGTGLAIRHYPPLRGPMIHFAARLRHNGAVYCLRIAAPWQPYQAMLNQLRDRILVAGGGGAILLVVVTLCLTGPVVRRAAALLQAITVGNFSADVRTEGRDEFSRLAKAVRQMGLELVTQLDRLRKNSDRLTVVLGTMTEGVVAIDNYGNVLFANHAARALLEFVTPEPVGRPLLEAIRNRQVHDTVQQGLSAREPRKIELELGGANRRTVEIHLRRLPGQPSPGALLVVHDVTELRRLENLRQEFVANVSHELKTPLTVIKAYAETLLEGAIEDKSHNRSFVRQIAEQAERLHQLILDLLSVARIESGHERFDFQPIALRELIDGCLKRYATHADAKLVQLCRDSDVDGLHVFADEEGLREILDNLVDNAIKYTPAGGSVKIACQPENGMVRIDVADTGIGIPPDHQSRIFERFYRVDKARSRELGGTGLGLSIVKHLVSAFGGTVVVRSEVNRGTTFTVRLPRA